MAKPRELDKLSPREQKKLLEKLIKQQRKRQGTSNNSATN